MVGVSRAQTHNHSCHAMMLHITNNSSPNCHGNTHYTMYAHSVIHTAGGATQCVWRRLNPFTLRWRIVLPTSYGLILGIFCTKTCRLHSTILLHGIAHFSDDPFELECLKMSLKLDYSTYYMLKKQTISTTGYSKLINQK